jgi:hypothetical protein
MYITYHFNILASKGETEIIDYMNIQLCLNVLSQKNNKKTREIEYNSGVVWLPEAQQLHVLRPKDRVHTMHTLYA